MAGSMQKKRAARVRQHGIATIWVILTIILLFSFVALAVDVIFVTIAGRQLSAGADAASLAAVAQVRRDQVAARDQAVALAAANVVNNVSITVDRNDSNTNTGDVVIGVYRRSDGSFTPLGPSEGLPNAVHVVAARNDDSADGPIPTIMASLFGVNRVSVEREATAMVRGDIGAGVIALDPTSDCALNMRGTSGTFTINDGALFVNSDSPQAACHSGQPTMHVEEVYVVGGTDNKFEDQVDLAGELIKDAEPVPDPLAALPEPNVPEPSNGDIKITTGTQTLLPGAYNDLEVTGGYVTFETGLYYITGELKITGGTVDATAGVMFFIAPGGNIDIAGNGTFQIVGMSPTVYPNGPAIPSDVADIQVPIFQSRSNTSDAELNGTPNWQIDGTVYIPSAKVTVEGTPGTFANGLITGRVEVRGTADINVDFEGQFPRLPRKVFLVE